MPPSEFRPGFRFSVLDAFILLSGTAGCFFVRPNNASLALIIALVVAHFFLFCNVFRISRGLELIWSAIFLILARLTIVNGALTWTTAIVLTLLTTIVVIALELRKPSYHGIGWSRINPGLREWWDAAT